MPGQGGDRDVLALEDQVLVHLVGDHQQVVLAGQGGDPGELGPGEHRPGRVVRRVQQQQPGARGDGGPQRLQVGAEPGGPQRDRDPGGARHGHAGGVGVVVGLERDGLVARLQERDQRGGDRLGGARGDQDLTVRVDVQAVEALLVGGDRVPQLGNARARGVLVAPPFQDRRRGRGGDLGRAVGVREALAEVDRPGRQGQRRHLGEDRRAHAGQPAVQQWSVHTAIRSRAAPPPGRASRPLLRPVLRWFTLRTWGCRCGSRWASCRSARIRR